MSVNEKMSAIADAIREKTGSTDRLTLDEMATAINSISGLSTDIVEFSQMNDKVTAYLAEADEAYTDDNSSTVSVMDKYETYANKDRPVGLTIPSQSGNLYLQDESNGTGYKQTVSEGTHIINNTIPDRMAQYLIKKSDGTLASNGRIKPTGKVRMLNFEWDARNSRDLGGWSCDGGTVQYGKLFRGAVVNNDAYKAQNTAIASRLGIRRHIDLRNDSEANYVTSSHFGSNVHYDRITLNLYYKNIIDEAQADYPNTKRIFRTIFDAVTYNEPLYYNCSLGRDRTGTITFMLLALLGVRRADIDKDYELSSFSSLNAWNNELIPAHRTSSELTAMVEYLNTFNGETLRDNVIKWFMNAGFKRSELNAFRKAMTNGTYVELTAEDFPETYNYSQVLTKCTSDYTETTVLEGSTLTVTLTPDSGYELNSIAVTMSGVDVTETVLNGNIISIENVTGEIVITAEAMAIVPKYTNRVPLSECVDSTNVYNNGLGYKNGYYISSSSGNESTKTGHVVTGMIPYVVKSGSNPPPTIYIKGGRPDRIGGYLEDKSFKTMIYAGSLTKTELGTNYYSYTPFKGTSGNFTIYENCGNIRYLRFDVIMDDGADLIITLDEPIE
jgi:protein-tyrosine phosphatase